MAEFICTDIEEHVFVELLEEINELYQQAERDIIRLENEADDHETQQSLFRALHTIKGDLGIIGLGPMVALVGSIEDLLDDLRRGQLDYSNLLSDAIFVVLDLVIEFVQSCQRHGKAHYSQELQYRLDVLTEQLLNTPTEQHPALLNQMVAALAPELVLIDGIDEPENLDWQHDLSFFRQLMRSVENRSRYWHDRAERQLKLALLINRYAGDAVDQRQLTAACYIHDFGMGFMPLNLLHKTTALTEQERELVKTHVYCSAKLLENMPEWQDAKMMVLQHHEQPNGAGYPLGLVNTDIHDGAKILALVDTFDALTHERANEQHTKRPIRRAMAEINRLAGTQLDSYWVTVFEQAMSGLLASKPTRDN